MTVNGRKGKKVILEKIRTSTLTSLDRLLLSFDSFRPSSFSRRIVHFDLWPFTLAQKIVQIDSRSATFARPSTSTPFDRPLSTRFAIGYSFEQHPFNYYCYYQFQNEIQSIDSSRSDDDVVMTSLWRHYYVIITSLLRHYYVIITSLWCHLSQYNFVILLILNK